MFFMQHLERQKERLVSGRHAFYAFYTFYAFYAFYAWWFISRSRGPLQKVCHGADTYVRLPGPQTVFLFA